MIQVKQEEIKNCFRFKPSNKPINIIKPIEFVNNYKETTIIPIEFINKHEKPIIKPIEFINENLQRYNGIFYEDFIIYNRAIIPNRWESNIENFYKEKKYEILNSQLIPSDEIFVPVSDRAIPGCKPDFLVSNYGRIYCISQNKFKFVSKDEKGYLTVNIPIYDFKSCRYKFCNKRINRIVIGSFYIIKDIDKYHVNHIDGIITNNKLCNLEYCDNEYNRYHLLNILEKRGKFTRQDIEKISKLIIQGKHTWEIAKIFNVKTYVITRIQNKQSYSEWTKGYDFKPAKDCINLSKENILEICKMINNGFSDQEIAKKYSLNRVIINDIRNKRTYTNITNNVELKRNTRFRSEETINQICQLMVDGKSDTEISKIVGMRRGYICQIRAGNHHKDIVSKYNIPKNKPKQKKIIMCNNIKKVE